MKTLFLLSFISLLLNVANVASIITQKAWMPFVLWSTPIYVSPANYGFSIMLLYVTIGTAFDATYSIRKK